MTKTNICVPFLHSGLGLLTHSFGCSSWVLLHGHNNDLVWLEGRSSLSGILPGLLSGNCLTTGSQEQVYTAALATCSFLYSVIKDGSSRPPFSLGKKRHPVSADLARPPHLFKNLVAMGCSVDSNQDTGKWLTERSNVRRGHTASLKRSREAAFAELKVGSCQPSQEAQSTSTRDHPWSCCLRHGHSQVLPGRRTCCFQ